MIVSIKSLVGKLNGTTRDALEAAAGLCMSRTHYDVEVEHFLVKLLDNGGADLSQIVRHFGLNTSRLSGELIRSLDRLKSGNTRTPAFSPYLVDALSKAWLFGSLEHNANQIRSGYTIAALVSGDELTRLVSEFSREIQLIRADELRKDFTAIVRGSVEDTALEQNTPATAETGGTRVFVSYRHEDSAFYADYLFDKLIAEVPGLRIFRDSDTLKPGMVYPEKIDETIAACDILLAIIGKKWLGAKAKSDLRRIDLPEDWVKLEVASALQQKKTVIPCLVGGARMPAATELPSELRGLASRHAITLSQDDLRRDARELVEMLNAWRRS